MSDEDLSAWLQEYADYLRMAGVSLPAGWLPYLFDTRPEVCPSGFMRLTGSVPIGKKRDGNPKWQPRSQGQHHFIDIENFKAWKESK